ncbi:MAG: SGNH/GDSL hydrolase family protein [Candidatus Nanopelagicaceae bacterium]|nr:SGNH/GDSL hydrolase family protein [Candidatus Nanopelagicaceae bacterium]
MKFSRLIACGDSFTEGMTDHVVGGQFRGWADRVADVMSEQNPDFTYMNVAIRGKLVRQVVDEQIPLALAYVTGPGTLLSFHAGANDVLRPNYKAEIVLPLYTQAIRDISKSGATILLFTVLERTDRTGKTADLWESRFRAFNENVRAVAREVGAVVADANEENVLSDRRFLADDRLHLNPLGHDRVAQSVLEKLELPYSANWREPLAPREKVGFQERIASNFRWYLTFLLPWMLRRLRGKSSGDGRSAKHSIPVSWKTPEN